MDGFSDSKGGTFNNAGEGNLTRIAQILKSNGNDGELVLGFRDIDSEDIDLEEPVFIFFDGLPVPFFFEDFRQRGNTKAIVRLSGISTPEDVAEVTGKAVYAEAFAGEDLSFEEDGFDALIGWTIFDGEEKIGTVTDFVDIPENPCLEVETANGEVLIPFHPDLLQEIDPETKSVVMQIPEGLL